MSGIVLRPTHATRRCAMRSCIVRASLLLVLVLCFQVTPGTAQSTVALKGNWTFTITMPTTGPIPAEVSFKTNGRGTIDLGPDALPFVYRESSESADFSMTFEVSREASITGTPFTALIRGRKTSASAISGVFYVILDSPDPAGAALL